MTIDYEPEDDFPTSITLPADGDPASAETFNLPYRQIVDRTEHLKARLDGIVINPDVDLSGVAFKDEPNTFVEPQIIEADNASTAVLTLLGQFADQPIIATHATPSDHPGNSGNQWKLLGLFKYAGGNYANIYLGANGSSLGGFAVVINAYWDVNEQRWVQDNTGQASTALVWRYDRVLVWKKPSDTTGHWLSSEWEGGQLDAGVVTGTDIRASNDVIAANRFAYATPPVIPKAIDPASFAGGTTGVSTINSGTVILLQIGGEAYYPLRFPHGAKLGQVRVKVKSFTQDSLVSVSLRRRYNVDFDDMSQPSVATDIGSHPAVNVPAGLVVTLPSPGESLTFGNMTVDRNESYGILISNGATSEGVTWILAIEVEYTDPGPRND